MDFNRFKEKIIEANPKKWIVVETLGYEKDQPTSIATYIEDLSLTIRYGKEHNDNFIEKWANNFPDEKARSYWVEYCYGENVIKRDVVVAVDGWRGHILLPLRNSSDREVYYENQKKAERAYFLEKLFGTIHGYLGDFIKVKINDTKGIKIEKPFDSKEVDAELKAIIEF